MKRKMKRTSSQRGEDGVLRRALLKLGAKVVGDTEVLWFCNRAFGDTHTSPCVFAHASCLDYECRSCIDVCLWLFSLLNV